MTQDDERFASYQGAETRDGCVPWTGSVQSNGYGFFTVEGRKVYAHRFAYERARGQIRKGHDVHHRCGVRRCVRLDHLEAIPASTHRSAARQEALSLI